MPLVHYYTAKRGRLDAKVKLLCSGQYIKFSPALVGQPGKRGIRLSYHYMSSNPSDTQSTTSLISVNCPECLRILIDKHETILNCTPCPQLHANDYS